VTTTLALSVLQPWAWAIIHAGKTIENRDWRHGCAHRGPLYIHASKWPATDSMKSEAMAELHDTAKDAIVVAHKNGVDLGPKVTLRNFMDARGCILGSVRVIAEVHERDGRGAVYERRGVFTRWLTVEEERWCTGGFGLLLADAKPTPLVKHKGALSLWRVTEEALAALDAEGGAR